MKKYLGLIFDIVNPGKELKEFLDGFLDDKHKHHNCNEERTQTSMVKYVNTETFERDVLKDKKVKQCVIEVYKDYCPGC